MTAGLTALWEDETCKSLLKTHLTTELLEKIKDLKTEDKGTLFDNIKSGLENHDLPVVSLLQLIILIRLISKN